MTYFGFLLIFLVVPIVALLALEARQKQSSRWLWWAIGAQIALALIYTTPWDNYLVATHVWYYNPRQVTGILLGYVPLEEYTFFVLETLLAGLWWRFCSTRLRSAEDFRPRARARLWAAGSTVALWIVLAVIFLGGWKQGTYLLITLVWALPPIILQLAYGADILWHERRLVGAAIFSLGAYLSAADAVAIRAGIWAIDPRQSTGLLVGGLPIEEAVFFFVTVILITFGVTLTLSEESLKRLRLHMRREMHVTIGDGNEASGNGPAIEF
jgi:lycopene cyclase domain-containing protein